MVKLYISLLTVTLATGSALASSNDYQRRSEEVQQAPNRVLRFGLACARHNNLQSRGFVDEEDLFVRDDAFDDLEAREPLGVKTASSLFSWGRKAAKHKHTKNALRAAEFGSQAYDEMKQSRGLEDDEDLFVRDLNAFDDLEAREPLGVKTASSLFSWGRKAAKHKHTKNALRAVEFGSQAYDEMKQSRGLEDDEDLFVRELDTFDDLEAREPLGVKTASSLFSWGRKAAKHKHTKNALRAAEFGSQAYDEMKQSRGLEDDEDLFVRELDAFDDLEAREPLGIKTASKVMSWGTRVSEHKHTQNAMKAVDYGSQIYGAYSAFKQSRGLEDDEDLFVRDLDAEELFGREYDLLDERDTIDDLD